MPKIFGVSYEKGEERFGPFTSRIYSFFAATVFRRTYLAIAMDVAKQKPRSVLDVGGGTGELITAIAEKLKSAKFCYVDPSEGMVSAAKKRLSKRGLSKRTKVAFGDSMHIPFKEKFDLIVSSFSFHHWAKKRESILYLSKLLNPGGKIMLYERDRDKMRGPSAVKSHFLSEKEILRMHVRGLKTRTRSVGNLLVVEFRR